MRWSSTIGRPRDSPKCTMTIADTALGDGEVGEALLDGLDVYTVQAEHDEHPLSVYGINSERACYSSETESLRPILLLHGRTWSSVPVFHLLGGSKQRRNEDESRSLMEALCLTGLQPYTMDFRGFGGTPPDATHTVEPQKCVSDVETVLGWIADRHGLRSKTDNSEMPALLGWSQGALVAQLVAQKNPTILSKLILYGSIYDPLVRYPREPLYTSSERDAPRIENTFDMALEDFTIEGSIPPEPAMHFAEAALQSDPIKAVWSHLYQFNNCDPARVHVPTLVVSR